MIFAIFAADREADGIFSPGAGEACFTRDRAADLRKRSAVRRGALFREVPRGFRRDRPFGAEQIDRNAISIAALTGHTIIGQRRFAETRLQRVAVDALDIFRLAIGALEAPIERVGDAAARTDAMLRLMGLGVMAKL